MAELTPTHLNPLPASDPTGLRVLVTGADGYIGTALVEAFTRQGFSVLTTDLNGTHRYVGDLTDSLFVEKLLEETRPAVVVHSAALVPLTRQRDDYQRVNADATEQLAAAARRHGATRFVLIGSSAVYGRPADYPITQHTETNPVEDYGRSKLQAEGSARRGWGDDSGLSVIRPRTVLGPNRMGIFDILFRWIRQGVVIPLPGGGANYLQFVHIDDLVALTVHLVEREIDGTWPAGGPGTLPLAAELDQLIASTGSRSRILNVPPALFRTMATFADRVRISVFQPFHYLTIDTDFAYANTWKPAGFDYLRSSGESLREAFEQISTPANTSPHTRRWTTPLLDIAVRTLTAATALTRRSTRHDTTNDARHARPHAPELRASRLLAGGSSSVHHDALTALLDDHLRRCSASTRSAIAVLAPMHAALTRSSSSAAAKLLKLPPLVMLTKMVVAHAQTLRPSSTSLNDGTTSTLRNRPDSTGPKTLRKDATQGNHQRPGHLDEVGTLIIGSGPGAASAALALFEQPAHESANSVLVVERGGRSSVPRDRHHTIEQVVKDFAAAGSELCLSWPLTQFAQGATFGGGSVVNSGLYHDLPAEIRDLWIQLSQSDTKTWDAAQQQIATVLRVSELPERLRDPGCSPIATAARELGLTHRHIPRWRTYTDDGYTHHGVNSTVWDTLALHPQSFALHTTVENLQPTPAGIIATLHSPEGERSVIAQRVVVAAGATQSARLLLRSGLVERHQVAFGFHPMQRVVAAFDPRSYGMTDVDPFQAWSIDGNFKFGGGVSTPSMLAASLGRLLTAEEEQTLRSVYISFVSSGNGGLLPSGLPFYRFSSTDRAMLRAGARQLLQFVEAAGGRPLQSFGTVKNSVSTVHVFGSLPLGSDIYQPGTSLLASDPRIGIYDASILPSAPGVNPQGPLMALALLLARRQLH
jgi:nucleoside-diphosphate-sugar epimerase